MELSEIKQHFGKTVLLTDIQRHIDNVPYTLTACIMRKGDDGFYYQVELLDACQHSVIIARLEKIKETQ